MGTSTAAVSYGYLIKQFGDRLQSTLDLDIGSNISWVWQLAVAIILATLARAIFLYGMSLANNVGVQRALVDIQSRQFSVLIDGDYRHLASRASGAFVSRFINDINVLRDVALRLANNATKSVVTLLGALAAMLWMDWQLSLFLFIVYPLAYGPVSMLGRRIRGQARRAQAQIGEVSAQLTEGFQAARIIKAYGLEERQKREARAGFIERARLYLSVLKDKAAVDPILEVAGGFALSGILAFSAFRVASGGTSFGDLLGFVALIGVAAPELRALGTLSTVAQEGGAAGDRIFELLDAERSTENGPLPQVLGPIRGALKFSGVDFAYEAGAPVLEDMSFEISAGETVAIVGPSGAGKSTIFNLLLRLYDPNKGTIALDGVPYSQIGLSNLRSAFALVEQDSILFDDSIAANIGMGKEGAPADAVEAAAQAADAHGFISAKAEGYAFNVGEGGGALSGGQRQRIALARALIRQAPVLLLDEATSALDTETEARVQSAIQEASQGRTVLIIAHKLATAQRADRILVLSEGRLAEQGTHEELVKANGVYAQLLQSELN